MIDESESESFPVKWAAAGTEIVRVRGEACKMARSEMKQVVKANSANIERKGAGAAAHAREIRGAGRGSGFERGVDYRLRRFLLDRCVNVHAVHFNQVSDTNDQITLAS